MWVRALADSDESCGGKAVGLARLIAAGLPVPDGFVIEDGAFRAIVGDLPTDPAALGHALEHAAARIADAPVADEIADEIATEIAGRVRSLGAAVAVRSSAAIEDAASGSAAGVFASVTNVAPADVWAAVRTVWSSALTPLAAAYGRGRPIAIAVIVQRYLPGERVTIYTRPPGAPDGAHVVVQRGEDVREYRRDDVDRSAGRMAGDPLVALALRAEQAIGAGPGAGRGAQAAVGRGAAGGAGRGADVELVVDRDGTPWLVQARPIVHPPPPARVPPPPALLAALVADGRRWTWDVTHNPDPLSPAQAGLVERVERAQIAPWSLRVCAGYLYTAPRGTPAPAVEIASPAVEIASAADLVARAAAIEARVAQILAGDAASLDAAIERYLAFYAVWANELVPLIAGARHGAGAGALGDAGARHGADVDALGGAGARDGADVDALGGAGALVGADALVGARPSAVEATLLAAARGELDEEVAIDRLAPLSPTWDVAVPTFGERPEVIREAIARARMIQREPLQREPLQREPINPLSPRDIARDEARIAGDEARVLRDDAREVDARVELARAAADLAERDDLHFARAQWQVRRALAERGRELGLPDDDIYWLSLEDLGGPLELDDARRRASAARAAHARAAKWAMPLVIGEAIDDRRPTLHGFGSGARISGRVVRFASLASAALVTRGDVIVTRAITPALAVFVVGCAAIVSETGGPLDHGAAIARELGVPFVVGCKDAWSLLHDGMLVTIEGDVVTPTRN